MMRNDCVFLKTGPSRREGSQPPHCTVGVNFYSVGPARGLCRLCPLLDREPLPVCDYAFIYAFLEVKDGRRMIQVKVECDADRRDEAGVGPCPHCLAYTTEGPVPWPEDASLPVEPARQLEGSLLSA